MWAIAGDIHYDSAENDTYNSTEGISWTHQTAGPAYPARTGLTCLAFDAGSGEKMWIIGGYSGGVLNDVWTSTDGKAFYEVIGGNRFPARQEHQSVVFDDGGGSQMWVIGGTGAVTYNDVWKSADGADWTCVTGNAEFSPVSGHQCVVFQNKIWLIKNNREVWWSSNGSYWTAATLSAAYPARSGFACVVFDNKIFLTGGGYSGNERSDVWYSEDGANWVFVADNAFEDRYNHTMVVFNSSMWVIGGESWDYSQCEPEYSWP